MKKETLTIKKWKDTSKYYFEFLKKIGFSEEELKLMGKKGKK